MKGRRREEEEEEEEVEEEEEEEEEEEDEDDDDMGDSEEEQMDSDVSPLSLEGQGKELVALGQSLDAKLEHVENELLKYALLEDWETKVLAVEKLHTKKKRLLKKRSELKSIGNILDVGGTIALQFKCQFLLLKDSSRNFRAKKLTLNLERMLDVDETVVIQGLQALREKAVCLRKLKLVFMSDACVPLVKHAVHPVRLEVLKITDDSQCFDLALFSTLLAECKGLKRLVFHFHNFTQDSLDAFSDALLALPIKSLELHQLTKVVLRHVRLDKLEMACFEHPTLEALHLNGVVFSREFFKSVAAKNTDTTTCLLKDLTFGADCGFFGNVLPRAPLLQRLSMKTLITNKFASSLHKALVEHRDQVSLESINFDNSIIEDQGFLSKLLTDLPSLKLFSCKYFRKGRGPFMSSLLRAMAAGSKISSLRLSLSSEPLDGNSLKLFRSAMAASCLRSVTLTGMDVSFKAFASALRHCALEYLKISMSELTDDREKPVKLKHVAPFRRLKVLQVKDSSMPDPSTFMRLFLTDNVMIENLAFGINDGAVVGSWADELATAVNLQDLSLGVEFEDGAEAVLLGPAIKSLPRLRSFTCSDYFDGAFDDEQMGSFLADIASSKSLKDVHLQGGGALTQASAKIAVKALAESQIGHFGFEVSHPLVLEQLANVLIRRNYVWQIYCTGEMHPKFQTFLARNQSLRTRCGDAVRTLIACRLFRSHPLLTRVPKPVVKMIGQFLWETRGDPAWDDPSVWGNQFPIKPERGEAFEFVLWTAHDNIDHSRLFEDFALGDTTVSGQIEREKAEQFQVWKVVSPSGTLKAFCGLQRVAKHIFLVYYPVEHEDDEFVVGCLNQVISYAFKILFLKDIYARNNGTLTHDLLKSLKFHQKVLVKTDPFDDSIDRTQELNVYRLRTPIRSK